jgi:hypothetical protein
MSDRYISAQLYIATVTDNGFIWSQSHHVATKASSQKQPSEGGRGDNRIVDSKTKSVPARSDEIQMPKKAQWYRSKRESTNLVVQQRVVIVVIACVSVYGSTTL